MSPPKPWDPRWWTHGYLRCTGCDGSAAILDEGGARWGRCTGTCPERPVVRIR